MTFRLRDGADDRIVRMAVVVRQMVIADVAENMFTADAGQLDRRT